MTDFPMQIFIENPHGPDWGPRLTAALQQEYGVRALPEPALAERPLCACGCGAPVQADVKDDAPNRYLHGHNLTPPEAHERAPRWTDRKRQGAAPTPRRAVKQAVARQVVEVRLAPECARCTKPFGPERARHWLELALCDGCAKRGYALAAIR